MSPLDPVQTTLATPGLCSVTFRDLSPEALIALARTNGVRAIEWGGDVHLPPDQAATKGPEIARLCREAGLTSPSYGSYLRAGDAGVREALPAVLEAAASVGAGNIRVWAGRVSGPQADAATWAAVRDDLVFMAEQAQRHGITVSVEYHRDTLTQEAADAARLFTDCNHANLFSYWQPVPGRGRATWLNEIAQIAPWLGYVHVFHWLPASPRDDMRPLHEGEEDWHALIAACQPAAHWPHGRTAFLEFVRENDPSAFEEDMKVLNRLCGLSGE